MKPTRRALLLAPALTAFAAALDDLRQSGRLTVGVLKDFPPFGSLNKDGDPVGFEVDVAALIRRHLSVRVDYVLLTAGERIGALQEDRVDVIAAQFGVTTARAVSAAFATPHLVTERGLFAAKDRALGRTEDMTGLRLGVVWGSPADLHLTNLVGQAAEILRYETDTAVFAALADGEVDAISQAVLGGAAYMAAHPDADMQQKLVLFSAANALAVRPDAVALRQWLSTFVLFTRQTGGIGHDLGAMARTDGAGGDAGAVKSAEAAKLNARFLSRYRSEWFTSFGDLRREVLAGMVGTFALIPEVIAFSFVAGVDPEVGLFASFVIGIVIAFTGGRPAMISGAAGSVALVAAALVRAHGLDFLLAATLLAGVFQIIFGLLRLDVLMRFVSRSVRTGFVNALAILIFSAQVPQMLGVSWQTYAMIAAGLAIIYLVPRLTTAVPSPLICIVILTGVSFIVPMPLRVVADLGRLPSSLPSLALPHVPLNWETLRIIAPYALAMAVVGLLESMMTATVVDDLTGTTSSKARECTGLGLANVATGLFGGIAGCGMIGQTVGNVRYGGRGRLSTLVAGLFLLILMVLLRPWVARVPVAALVAIMIMVSVSTFSWSSFRGLVHHPKVSSLVMLATVAVTVATSDLAAGVVVGVLLSGVFFAFKVMRLMAVTSFYDEATDTRTYTVSGQVFFASADMFADSFDLRDTAAHVRIDLSGAHFWDVTSVGALEGVVTKMRRHGTRVELIGMNEASATLIDRHGPLIQADR